MKNQVLSINQMQELKELGIDTSKASMCWLETFYTDRTKKFEPEVCNENQRFDEWCLPAFTLQDILEILPREIKPFEGCKSWKKVWLRLLPYAGNRWCVLYENPDEVFYRSNGENPLEAAFNMLKWCKQNNYI